MKNYRSIILIFLISLTACIDDYEARVKTEPLSSFTTIRLKGVFDVVLKNDDSYSITITADDDVINEIDADVISDTLIISNGAKGKWLNPERNRVRIQLSAPLFYTLIAEDSYSLTNEGELTITDFFIWNYSEVKVSEIDMSVNGSTFYYWNNWLAGGKISVSGEVENLYINNYALHLVDTRNLVTHYTWVSNYGREDCIVYAGSRLDYILNGPGNIIYYGNPSEINLVEKTSSGQLIQGH
jgi:hypothetical protein